MTLTKSLTATKFLPAARAVAAALGIALLSAAAADAQTATTYSENFTGTSTTNSWYFINGACLTAGSAATSTAANPGCTGLAYYTNKGDTQRGGNTGSLPDTTANGGGALRFTNNSDNENGAILSNFNFPLSSSGLAVSFTTVTYAGDSGGSGQDGADGMSFFLQNAAYAADVGAFGGSLGYTCSNTNNDGTLRASGQPRGYDGLGGGYIGLGIDEYGNFLNSPDNTSTGDAIPTSGGPYLSGNGQYQPGRIGMRGPGSTLWSYLNATYPTQYPSSLSNSARAAAVQSTCKSGYVWDYSLSTPAQTSTAVPNYAVIPSAWQALPATNLIAAEKLSSGANVTLRSQATPITYNLKITSAGLLSLSYSYNGGALQNVISGVDITNGNNNPLPATVRFGFAGSTGGSNNIHEVMCFQATPSVTASSSASLNQKQTSQVQAGTQLYFAYYNPATLAGSVTAQNLVQSTTNANLVSISPIVNWDASCVLTGSATQCDPPASGQTGGGPASVAVQAPSARTILSFAPADPTSVASTAANPGPGGGIAFQWANLTSTEKSALDTGDATTTTLPAAAYRLNYLRGDRTQEQTPATATTFNGIYRDRTSVLGDIIDSSPTWVGPPIATFPGTWVDSIDSTDTMSENSGQAYSTFASFGTSTYVSGTAANNKEAQRTNVVYAGANDGLLHGFRSGSFSSATTFVGTNNDGHEVLAFMPAYVVNHIQTSSNVNNFSDPQYGHQFSVDAAPGTGDLFYKNVWHTWLVGGLGPGGKAIYALDITDPDAMFMESTGTAGTGPTSVVKGEWSSYVATSGSGSTFARTLTSTTMNCVGDTSTACGSHLGDTYGIPQIRRFHNGSWGAVFGNGLNSVSADAGIFVMLVAPSNGAISFYYLTAGSASQGTANSPNGIAYVTAADLDGDHITDYVYAGDVKGNVWRFDLTSTSPASWAVTSTRVYTPGSGAAQPITSKVSVIAAGGTGSANPHLLIEFGTGQQVPMTNYSSASYSTTTQSLMGIWDWNMSAWNALSSTKYAVPTSGTAVSGTTSLQQQTVLTTTAATATGTGTDYRTISQSTVCYADISGCTRYGWYLNLASGHANPSDPATPNNTDGSIAANPTVYEQVVFNPIVEAGAFIVNTTIPAATSATMCFSSGASGWTMALNPATGGAFNTAFFADSLGNFLTVADPSGTGQDVVSGLALAGTGTPYMYQSGLQYGLAMQTTTGTPTTVNINPQNGTKGKRLTWIEKR